MLVAAASGCAGPGHELHNDLARVARFDRSTRGFEQRLARVEVLHVFRPDEGLTPGGMVVREDGGFVGISATGGAFNQGTVFRLSPSGLLTVIHDFGEPAEGAPAPDRFQPPRVPRVTSLVDGGNGTYVGSVSTGGKDNGGILFSIDRAGRFQLIEAPTFHVTVNRFAVRNPSGVRRGPGSEMYVSAFLNPDDLTNGTRHETGGVFKLGGDGRPGQVNARVNVPFPVAVTSDGGVFGVGAENALIANNWVLTQYLFGISPAGEGSLLYTFPAPAGPDHNFGAAPSGAVAVGPDGDIYGATAQGGELGLGAIFKFSPSTGRYMLLYSFSGKGDGGFPEGPLIPTGHGSFYGVTRGAPGAAGLFGSKPAVSGSVFEVTLDGRLTVLHSFDDTGERLMPFGGVVLDSRGRLYGFAHRATASVGGASVADALFALAL